MKRQSEIALSRGLCALLFMACSPRVAKLNEGASDSKLPRGDSSSINAEERVDVPVKISGSYLVCALRKQAKAEDLNAQYGCRLNEEGTNEKVDLTATQQQVQWGSSSPDVRITVLAPDNIWHAYYNLRGDSIDAINSQGANLDVQVRWRAPNQAPTPVKQSRITQVLQPAQDYGDTTAPVVIEGGIDPNDAPAL